MKSIENGVSNPTFGKRSFTEILPKIHGLTPN